MGILALSQLTTGEQRCDVNVLLLPIKMNSNHAVAISKAAGRSHFVKLLKTDTQGSRIDHALRNHCAGIVGCFAAIDLPLALAETKRPSPFPTHLHGYGDDAQIHNAAPANLISADDVHTLIEWLTHNKLRANPNKFKYMLNGAAAMFKRIPEELSKIEIDNNTLTRAEVAKILSIVINQNLNGMYT